MMGKTKSYTILKNVADRIWQISEELLHSVQSDATKVGKDTVPAVHGIYIWRFKEDGCPAYIGVGLSKKGLQQRIVRQHLCASYTKSVFRKAIVQEARVDPRQESVTFIRSHFTFAFLICSEDAPAVVKAAEALLIAALNPKYNKKGELPTS